MVTNSNPVLSQALIEALMKADKANMDRDTFFRAMLAVPAEKGDSVRIRHPEHGVVSIRGHEYWMCDDGRFMALTDMSVDHLRRCIGKIFLSKTGWRASYMPHLIEELNRREGTDGHRDGDGDAASGG